MNAHKAVKILVLCIAVCLMFCLVVDQAHAQKKADAGADKTISAKKGMDALNSVKKKDDFKTPSALQKVVGVGSFFVMIAVVKFL